MSVALSTLGAEATIIMGQSPPGESYNRDREGVPLLNGPSEFGPVHPIEVQWTTSPTKLCQPGDVLFCVRGATAGRLNMADKEYCIGRGLAAIRGRIGRFHGGFLRYVLANGYARFQSRGVGSTFINIGADELARFPVPALPLAEQRRIAEILDKADALRAKRRAALAQLDTLTQSVFRRLFGDLRGRDGRWPIVPFEAIVRDTKLGLVRGSEEVGPHLPIPYVRMNAINRSGELDLSNVLGTHATDAEIEAYHLQSGDLLFNTRNSKELVGKTALYRASGLHLFNNNIMRIRVSDEADPEYVAAVFRTTFVQHELELRKSGTTSVFAIYYKDLRTLPVPLPPIELQRGFSWRVAAIEALKATQRSALAGQDALFASVQGRAFRGELVK